MKQITRDMTEQITLDASLQRLGVIELEERLEFSPLLVEGGLQESTTDSGTTCCVCKIPDGDLYPPAPGSIRPIIGDGSTGPTSGDLVW